MKKEIYVVRGVRPPWGDYGRVLIHGISSRLARERGRIQLERTGPFVPPLTFPGVGQVVATQQARSAFQNSGLTQVGWTPVDKRHIVELDWQSWDRGKDLPPVLPAGGEPEAYVIGQPHSQEVARAMPEFWEVSDLKRVGNGTQRRVGKGKYVVSLTVGDDVPDFFQADGVRHLFAAERAADWLRSQFEQWLHLEPVDVTGT